MSFHVRKLRQDNWAANQGTACFAPEIFFGQMYEADCRDCEDDNDGQNNDDDHEGDSGDDNENDDADDDDDGEN